MPVALTSLNKVRKYWPLLIRKPIYFNALEIHLTHLCNLHCESCSHFSNFATPGNLTVENFERWSLPWKDYLAPHHVTLLGGEPTLNPQLCELLESATRIWRKRGTFLVLTTNGFFLDRHPRLEKTLRENGIRLRLSKHGNSPSYDKRWKDALERVGKWRGVSIAYTNNTGAPDPTLEFSLEKWTRRYHYDGAKIFPYQDGAPEESWKICPAKLSITLEQGRLWKCPPIAYLRLLEKKKLLGEEWAPYLAYEGIGPDCSYTELKKFIGREVEPICGMCPAQPHSFVKPDPMLPLKADRKQ